MVSVRCNFVRHSHGFIPTKNTFARVNLNNGVERTILTLSTGGNEQNVKAMLELYCDLIETPKPQPDQENTLKGFQSDQKIISDDQEINQEITCDTQTDLKTDQEITDIDQIVDQKTKILTLIKSNPKITRLEIGKDRTTR